MEIELGIRLTKKEKRTIGTYMEELSEFGKVKVCGSLIESDEAPGEVEVQRIGDEFLGYIEVRLNEAFEKGRQCGAFFGPEGPDEEEE